MTGCPHDWSRTELGEAAEEYASLGLHVLPLGSFSKKPHKMLGATGGVHRATGSLDAIRSWWRKDPQANIGIATGKVLAVVDLDVKHGSDGPGSMASFMAGYGLSLPPGGVAETPSGGYHLWHRAWPMPGRQGILPGVDIKANGGYVVAAPSALAVFADGNDGEHGGEVLVSYRWQPGSCACYAPDAPRWLGDWAANATAQGTGGAPHDDLPDIEHLLKNGIPPGDRNRTMHQTACRLFRKFSREPDGGIASVTEVMRVIWEHTDQHDYPWSEVLTSRESARRFIAQQEQYEASMLSTWLKGIRG